MAFEGGHLVVREVDVPDVFQRSVEVGETLGLDLYGQGILVRHDTAGSGDGGVHVDAERVVCGMRVVELAVGAGEVRRDGGGGSVHDGDVLVYLRYRVGFESLPAFLEVAGPEAPVLRQLCSLRVTCVQVIDETVNLGGSRTSIRIGVPAQLHHLI